MKPELNTLLLLEKKEARIAELEDWKAQAMTALGQWSSLFEALPKEHTQSPKYLGRSQYIVVGAFLMKLKTENARLREALLSVESALEFSPEYHHQGMGAGLEDRGIHDRYEAAEYGWNEAIERVGNEAVGPARDIVSAALSNHISDANKMVQGDSGNPFQALTTEKCLELADMEVGHIPLAISPEILGGKEGA
jgi:hypothetical protein